MHGTGIEIIEINTQFMRSKLLQTCVSISAEPSTTLKFIVVVLSTSMEVTPYYLQSSQNRFPSHTSNSLFISVYLLDPIILYASRSQWPSSLRRGSSAALLLRMWVRMPPEVGNVCLS